MRTGIVVFVLLTALAGGAVAGEADKQEKKGEKSFWFPKMAFRPGYHFDSQVGLIFPWEGSDVPTKVVAIEKTMAGDASDAELYERGVFSWKPDRRSMTPTTC